MWIVLQRCRRVIEKKYLLARDPAPCPFTTPTHPTPPSDTDSVFCFCTQNLTNEEQVVVIQARTVLTLAEKVTGTLWMSQRGGAPIDRYSPWEEGLQGRGMVPLVLSAWGN